MDKKRPGPKIEVDTKCNRVTMSLDERTSERLVFIGDGNVSFAVRQAARLFMELYYADRLPQSYLPKHPPKEKPAEAG